MITIKYKDLKFASIFCLSLMSLIFFITWLKAFVGIPFAILLFLAVIISRKPDDRELKIKASSLIFIVLAVLIWAILAGQGGFFTQKDDHWARNVIFRDLINYDWPVRFGGENDQSLVYYIGHWLLPALIGKIGVAVGGFEVGYLVGKIALLLWTSLIIILAILNVMVNVNCNTFKKLAIVMSVFIFFSGMDAFASIISVDNFQHHIEWWALPFQYSSMTTQLFWTYNQTVATWLAVSLILNEKDESNYALIGLLILPSSPLPLVGLAIYLIALAIVRMVKCVKQKNVKDFFKKVFSVQNILAVVTILPVFALYYLNNSSSSNTTSDGGTFFINITDNFVIVKYILFVILEFLILSMLLYRKENKTNWTIMLVSLLFIPFFRIGGAYDFCMRASIPALFVLMMMLIDFFVNHDEYKLKIKDKKEKQDFKIRTIMIAVIFIIGSITPMVEFGTSIRDYVKTNGQCVTDQEQFSSLTEIKEAGKGNFIGIDSAKSPFFKYIGKN